MNPWDQTHFRHFQEGINTNHPAPGENTRAGLRTFYTQLVLFWSHKLDFQGAHQSHERSFLRTELKPLLTSVQKWPSPLMAWFPWPFLKVTLKCNFLHFQAFLGLAFLKADFVGLDPTLGEKLGGRIQITSVDFQLGPTFVRVILDLCHIKYNTCHKKESLHNHTGWNDSLKTLQQNCYSNFLLPLKFQVYKNVKYIIFPLLLLFFFSSLASISYPLTLGDLKNFE